MTPHEETLLRVSALSMPMRIDRAIDEFTRGEALWRDRAREQAVEHVTLARDVLAQCVTDLDGLLVTMKEPPK